MVNNSHQQWMRMRSKHHCFLLILQFIQSHPVIHLNEVFFFSSFYLHLFPCVHFYSCNHCLWIEFIEDDHFTINITSCEQKWSPFAREERRRGKKRMKNNYFASLYFFQLITYLNSIIRHIKTFQALIIIFLHFHLRGEKKERRKKEKMKKRRKKIEIRLRFQRSSYD